MKKISLCIAAALFGLAHVSFVVAEGTQQLSADVLIAPLIAAEHLLLQRRMHEPSKTRQPQYINYSFS